MLRVGLFACLKNSSIIYDFFVGVGKIVNVGEPDKKNPRLKSGTNNGFSVEKQSVTPVIVARGADLSATKSPPWRGFGGG